LAAVLGAGGAGLLLDAGAPVLESLGRLLVEDGLLHGGAHLMENDAEEGIIYINIYIYIRKKERKIK